MCEQRQCKFCNEMVDWEDLGSHMITRHREKVIELFGTQIDDFLDDVVYDHFEELVVVTEELGDLVEEQKQ